MSYQYPILAIHRLQNPLSEGATQEHVATSQNLSMGKGKEGQLVAMYMPETALIISYLFL